MVYACRLYTHVHNQGKLKETLLESLVSLGCQCFSPGLPTPDLFNKKHLHFGQGLEFLKFGQGNRDLNQQNQRKTKETIRNIEGKTDKKIRDRDPYFLFKIVFFNVFSVSPLLAAVLCRFRKQSQQPCPNATGCRLGLSWLTVML